MSNDPGVIDAVVEITDMYIGVRPDQEMIHRVGSIIMRVHEEQSLLDREKQDREFIERVSKGEVDEFHRDTMRPFGDAQLRRDVYELSADNAALLDALKKESAGYYDDACDDEYFSCPFCECPHVEKSELLDHKPECLLLQERPGRKFLEEMELLRRIETAARGFNYKDFESAMNALDELREVPSGTP